MSSYLDVLPAMCVEINMNISAELYDWLRSHWPLILDAGTGLVSVLLLSCAGYVYCHCTGRWAVLDNTHGNDSGAFR